MMPFSSSSESDGRLRSWRATVSAFSWRSSWCFVPWSMGETVAFGSNHANATSTGLMPSRAIESDLLPPTFDDVLRHQIVFLGARLEQVRDLVLHQVALQLLGRRCQTRRDLCISFCASITQSARKEYAVSLTDGIARPSLRHLLSITPFESSSVTGGRFDNCWLTLSAFSCLCSFSCVACRLGATPSSEAAHKFSGPTYISKGAWSRLTVQDDTVVAEFLHVGAAVQAMRQFIGAHLTLQLLLYALQLRRDARRLHHIALLERLDVGPRRQVAVDLVGRHALLQLLGGGCERARQAAVRACARYTAER